MLHTRLQVLQIIHLSSILPFKKAECSTTRRKVTTGIRQIRHIWVTISSFTRMAKNPLHRQPYYIRVCSGIPGARLFCMRTISNRYLRLHFTATHANICIDMCIYTYVHIYTHRNTSDSVTDFSLFYTECPSNLLCRSAIRPSQADSC